MQKRNLAGAMGLMLMVTACSAASALTPQQIAQRCQKAYDAVHTYQGTVKVTATSGMGGGQTFHTTARIIFARPGKIRASGTSMVGGPYAYVSNGKATYQNIAGNWSKCQSAEMAVAGATGLAQSAATTIPALLLHTQWGQPFFTGEHFQSAVGSATVDGHSCYHLTATSAVGSSGYWIDKRSFLLIRMVSTLSMGQMHLHQDQHITNGPLNAPTPPGAFTLPRGG